MNEFQFELTPEALDTSAPEWDGRFGADLTFAGVVRDTEDGSPIRGIEYSAYPPMVREKMAYLGRAAGERFGAHRAKIVHRTGFVEAAEPSLLLQVAAAHSAEAFEICQWYLEHLKREIPIWKNIVTTRSEDLS